LQILQQAFEREFRLQPDDYDKMIIWMHPVPSADKVVEINKLLEPYEVEIEVMDDRSIALWFW
jgi:hypothetical protein